MQLQLQTTTTNNNNGPDVIIKKEKIENMHTDRCGNTGKTEMLCRRKWRRS
jgi:hypothetical protein